jgi:hypothetical protein
MPAEGDLAGANCHIWFMAFILAHVGSFLVVFVPALIALFAGLAAVARTPGVGD